MPLFSFLIIPVLCLTLSRQCASLPTGARQESSNLHIISFNIRLDTPNDGFNRWENRIPLVRSYLQKEMPDIIGMQEVLHNQLLDLQQILPGYSYVGKGREDNLTGGEYSPIFYRQDRFKLIRSSQFWLSETPEIPGSKSWDAAITRIVTWAELEHIPSGKVIFCFNTHFDHIGTEARSQSVSLMSSRIKEIAGDRPVIVTGDFNIRKQKESSLSALYNILTKTFAESNGLQNAEYLSSTPVTQGGDSFNGYKAGFPETDSYPIDFIFVNKFFRVQQYRVDYIMEAPLFISDHWPVSAWVNF